MACFLGAAALAQGPSNVLLVINGNSADSRAVGEYYRQKREIPASNVCTLTVQAAESIDHDTFEKAIRSPVSHCIADKGLQDKILYIVLTKGIPLSVVKTTSPKVEDGSVDSELALLYTAMLGIATPKAGKVLNPYYARNSRADMVRFSHKDFLMYLVTRIDGYDVPDAKALVDRALAAKADGRFIFDQKAQDETGGNGWLSDAASRLHAAGIQDSRITLDAGPQYLTGQDRVLGYASWGSNDPANHSRFTQNHWLPGALMAEFVSSDARTFQRPPEKWNIGSWKDSPKSFFHDTPQSLIGDYIHEGVTGVAGNVSEPLLDACVRPQILFPAYVRGLNLAESYYSAMPFLNWKGVVIGDPLAAPFAKGTLPALPPEQADPPVNRNLGIPAFFAKHLLDARSRVIGETPEVTELLMITERLARQRDIAGARQSAERAVKLAPDSAHTLGMMAQLSPPPQAMPLYKRVVEIAPQDGNALNNLAYMLAVAGRPREALPFAARAADLAQGRQGPTLDTYGWVLYLLDQIPEGCESIQKAAKLSPASADIAYHLGMCLVKQGKRAEGRAQFERALTLGPSAAMAAAIRKVL